VDKTMANLITFEEEEEWVSPEGVALYRAFLDTGVEALDISEFAAKLKAATQVEIEEYRAMVREPNIVLQ
jgi:hypothetical protein